MTWLEELARQSEKRIRDTPDELLGPAGRILKHSPTKRATEVKDDAASCACGSEWFRLVADEGQDISGVTIDNQGIITGFCGRYSCIECGLFWKRPGEHLSVVR